MPEHCKILLRRPLSAPTSDIPGQVAKNIATHHKPQGPYEGRKQCFTKSSKQSPENEDTCNRHCDTTVNRGQLSQPKQSKPYLEHKWNKLQLKNFPPDCQSSLAQINNNISTGSRLNQTLSDVSITKNGGTLNKGVVNSQSLADPTSKLSICYPYDLRNGTPPCHTSNTCNGDSKVLVYPNTLEFQRCSDIDEKADIISKKTCYGQPGPSHGFHMQRDKDMNHFAMHHEENNLTNLPLQALCNNERLLPACLGSLREWLVPDDHASVIEDMTGISPHNALIFLTDSHLHNLNSLPVLPSPHDVNEDLPHYGVIKDSPEEMIETKKYRHPWIARKYDSYGQCDHVHGGSFKKSRYKLEFRKKGAKERTPELVRREMHDLECLLKGIAIEDSDCIVVQYQNDIHHLQSLVTSVLGSITIPSASEDCDRWTIEEVPNHTSALKQSIHEHEEVISAIKQQHDACVQELQELEQNLTGHRAKYF